MVRVDDAPRTGVRPSDRGPSAVRGGIGLFGEVREDVLLVSRRNADQPAVLGGEEDAALTETTVDGALHTTGDGIPLGIRGGTFGDGHGMGVREPQPEPFRAFGQKHRLAAPVQQVVDELPSRRLLFADGELLGALVALAERFDGQLDGAEHTGGSCGPGRPGGPGQGEMVHDQGPQRGAVDGSLFAEGTEPFHLGRVRLLARCRDRGQQGFVAGIRPGTGRREAPRFPRCMRVRPSPVLRRLHRPPQERGPFRGGGCGGLARWCGLSATTDAFPGLGRRRDGCPSDADQASRHTSACRDALPAS
ncbi:hypothetical protein STIB_40150 [Streptomyces sp. IB2014 011-1]|nr:hypothetical protein STIB_40150 [Streptomyces sp. IB2014 011-1]